VRVGGRGGCWEEGGPGLGYKDLRPFPEAYSAAFVPRLVAERRECFGHHHDKLQCCALVMVSPLEFFEEALVGTSEALLAISDAEASGG